MTFFTITILSRCVRSRLVRPSVLVEPRLVRVESEWKETGHGRQGGQTCRRGRLPKSVWFTFLFSFAFCSFFITIYDHYDMMCSLALFIFIIFFFLHRGGARRFVGFGLVGVGKEKRLSLVLGFIVLCLDWEWRRGSLLFDCLCLRHLWYYELEWPTHSLFLPVRVLQCSAGGG